MKKNLLTLTFLLLFSMALSAQSGYQFTTVKQLPITSIKNQSSTSTCWCFSSISFIESELIRMGKGEHDLSEMFIVSNAYADKMEKYIRLRGNLNFAPGSSFGDLLTTWKEYGMVPNEVMPGLNYGETLHRHNELDAGLKGYADAVVKNPNRKYTPVIKEAARGILAAYLGEIPKNFTYKGKSYTPKSFATELGINPDDYISLGSFTHHPFYSQFVIEVPDNWRWDISYNLPLDEFMQVFDYAINNGYTVAWASDVSESGFSRNGIGIIPETEVANMTGSDQARWVGVSQEEMNRTVTSFSEIVPEKKITQEMRQIAFDNGQTTDDHGMHIFGIANDQKGNKYYMVKNSWGETGAYKGIWYVSEPFVKYKTTNIVVHKNSIPAAIKTKLGIN